MFKRRIYKCDLLSISPDTVIYSDKSMKKNLENANTNVVATILVKETINIDYVREIVTNKLIPIYKIVTYDAPGYRHHGTIDHIVPKSPVFIKISETLGFEGIIEESDFTPATNDEIKEYLTLHNDPKKYKNELEEIFRLGEEYYNNSRAKGIVTEETEIKRMIKTIKRCNK